MNLNISHFSCIFMIPKKEKVRILEVTEAYRNWHHFFVSEFYPRIRHMFTGMYMPAKEGPKLPNKNPLSLDDQCKFGGRQYTVRQLIAQMRRGSKVGEEFAKAVYEQAQNQPHIEDVVKDDGTVFCMGQTQIPAHLGVQLLVGIPDIGHSLEIVYYVTAIHQVTHPKTK